MSHFLHLTPHKQDHFGACCLTAAHTFHIRESRFDFELEVTDAFHFLTIWALDLVEWFLYDFTSQNVGGIGVSAYLQTTCDRLDRVHDPSIF